MAVVYGLTSVLDGYRVRYVGQAKNLDKRLASHAKAARDDPTNRHLIAWMRSRLAVGVEIIAVVLKTDCVWNDDERFFIDNLRRRGFDLANMTDGGDGGEMPRASIVRGMAKRAARSRTEREIAADIRRSDAVRAAIAARGGHWTKGVKQSPGQIARNAVARTGIARPNSGAAISAALRGRIISAEHRAKIAVTRLRYAERNAQWQP